jgi:hypothetical protein
LSQQGFTPGGWSPTSEKKMNLPLLYKHLELCTRMCWWSWRWACFRSMKVQTPTDAHSLNGNFCCWSTWTVYVKWCADNMVGGKHIQYSPEMYSDCL